MDKNLPTKKRSALIPSAEPTSNTLLPSGNNPNHFFISRCILLLY